MLAFKKNILSQITKRQEQDSIMRRIDIEIEEKEAEYEDEKERDFEDHSDDENGEGNIMKKFVTEI